MEHHDHCKEAIDAIDKCLDEYYEGKDPDEIATLAWDGLVVAVKSKSISYSAAAEHMKKWFPDFSIPDYSELGVTYDPPEPMPGC